MKEHDVRMKVDFANVFFFFLFGASSIAIIWLAQKYLHKRSLADLGFRTKILKLSFIGFVMAVFWSALALCCTVAMSRQGAASAGADRPRASKPTLATARGQCRKE
jgi:hypothetical protein